MSTRVSKVVGYGVDDLTPEEYAQYRWHWDVDDERPDGAMELPEWLGWWQEHAQEIYEGETETAVSQARCTREYLVQDITRGASAHADVIVAQLVHVNPLRCPATTLVVATPESRDWYRHNNDLDWIEETAFHNQVERVHRLDLGIPPHEEGSVPLEIKAILLWFGLPGVWARIRPLLYVYWS